MVAGLACFAVYFILYPYPHYLLLDISAILLILICVDIVCGPLLTAVIASPKKSTQQLFFDISLIGLIQLSALFYGLYTVYTARPVAIAFEVDRFVVIQAADIDKTQLPLAPLGLQALPSSGIMLIGTRKHKTQEEFFELVELTGSGISPGMRPKWWTPYSDIQSNIIEKMKPISPLAKKTSEGLALINDVVPKNTPLEELSYLPLTRGYNSGWIVILNKQASIVGYAPLDGFE